MFHVCVLKVPDSNPLPGMMITPSEGVVPVGGHAVLNIYFSLNAKMSFDTRVEVLKTGRPLSFECYVLMCIDMCMFDSFGSYLQCSNYF